ncbi:uncharacterized protein LOC120324783 [Pipra filicauda]|uniref:Uncharacterized protein LOC120324783 n=1 Tax=Pipra filicauda TaxID=649802 RepID=A0A7R5KUU7_9PASS|nr:uncharacterized protein LOC120324783 [Pipra filicauda]
MRVTDAVWARLDREAGCLSPGAPSAGAISGSCIDLCIQICPARPRVLAPRRAKAMEGQRSVRGFQNLWCEPEQLGATASHLTNIYPGTRRRSTVRSLGRRPSLSPLAAGAGGAAGRPELAKIYLAVLIRAEALWWPPQQSGGSSNKTSEKRKKLFERLAFSSFSPFPIKFLFLRPLLVRGLNAFLLRGLRGSQTKSFKIITEQLLVAIELLFTGCQTEARLLDGNKLKTPFAIQYCSCQYLRKNSENAPKT